VGRQLGSRTGRTRLQANPEAHAKPLMGTIFSACSTATPCRAVRQAPLRWRTRIFFGPEPRDLRQRLPFDPKAAAMFQSAKASDGANLEPAARIARKRFIFQPPAGSAEGLTGARN